MKDIDTTEEVRMRNDFGINNSDQKNIEDYSMIYQNDARSLLINGKEKMLGEYYLEIIDNKDHYSKISFSQKTDTDINFFEYAKQDDQISFYNYNVEENGRVLKIVQSVLDSNYIDNNALYKMIMLDKDKSNNYPLAGYEHIGSVNVILNIVREDFKKGSKNFQILNTIIEHINLKNNFDITDRVFNSVAAQELEQCKTKKLK